MNKINPLSKIPLPPRGSIGRTFLLCVWALKYALLTIKHKWFVMHGYFKARVPNWFWHSIWHDMSKFGPREIFAYGFAFFGPLSKLPANLQKANIVIEKIDVSDGASAEKKPFIVYAQHPKDCDSEAALGSFRTEEDAIAYSNFLARWKEKWQRAWLRHQSRNPHHWEYWIPRTAVYGHRNMEPIRMPTRYVRELIGDWLAASRAYTGSWDMEEWLSKNVGKVALHNDSGDDLQKILEGMYGQSWVEAVFNSLDAAWDQLFENHRQEFMDDPEQWFDRNFKFVRGGKRVSVIKFTSDVDDNRKPWTRLLIRVNNPTALSTIDGKTIILRKAFKDAGPGKVIVFYVEYEPKTLGEVKADAEGGQPLPPSDSSEETNTDGPDDERSDAVGANAGDVSGSPDDGDEGDGAVADDGGDDSAVDGDGRCDGGSDSPDGDGDATDPDADGDGDDPEDGDDDPDADDERDA